MAARKLQTEIDRTLKKVAEGVELFESIYDKMQASTNQTQKEKLETDLKTQIKKLQRLRDQIKTWVASNEIKDKSVLLDNRKLIETQMEKFKACEKEMKTKAFSKDGLNAAQKLDPKEREKVEMSSWIAAQVEELMRQVEQTEAEIEQLQGGTARSRRAKAAGNGGGRAEELTTLNERRKWHVGRLEIVMRLLENNTLQTDTVAALKEHISYFVESNTGEDFEFDEGVYDELNLDEEEEAFGIAGDDGGSDAEEESIDERPSRPSARDLKSKALTLDDDSHSKKDESDIKESGPSQAINTHRIQTSATTIQSCKGSTAFSTNKGDITTYTICGCGSRSCKERISGSEGVAKTYALDCSPTTCTISAKFNTTNNNTCLFIGA